MPSSCDIWDEVWTPSLVHPSGRPYSGYLVFQPAPGTKLDFWVGWD